MKAILKTYSNRHNYELDYPDKKEMKLTISEAVTEAKKKIAEVRNTTKFLGYKVYDTDGFLKYKLPSY